MIDMMMGRRILGADELQRYGELSETDVRPAPPFQWPAAGEIVRSVAAGGRCGDKANICCCGSPSVASLHSARPARLCARDVDGLAIWQEACVRRGRRWCYAGAVGYDQSPHPHSHPYSPAAPSMLATPRRMETAGTMGFVEGRGCHTDKTRVQRRWRRMDRRWAKQRRQANRAPPCPLKLRRALARDAQAARSFHPPQPSASFLPRLPTQHPIIPSVLPFSTTQASPPKQSRVFSRALTCHRPCPAPSLAECNVTPPPSPELHLCPSILHSLHQHPLTGR